MNIFSDYTGNTMLNNALQAIEAMTELEHVSQITPELLLERFNRHDLPKLYARMQNYTIIFTRNGPLLNDQKLGEQIYRKLFEKILTTCENDGANQCEISGLRYKISFSELYTKVLEELNIDASTRDTSINRAWWPLIGALGSDAQALPGAKFAVQIHPICLAIIQFLPLTAVLYRGKVLLIESVNFEYSKSLVQRNYQAVQERIASVSLKAEVQNIKYSKPEYLRQALAAYHRLSRRYEDYTDLNFWMFSNSGAGAACEIDRIPNTLFQKLYVLYSRHSQVLQDLLGDKRGYAFMECLDRNENFWGLYPSKNWQGLSVDFFEDFHKLIDNDRLLNLAGYIAGLIDKYQTDKDKKLLEKTDAHNDEDYRDFFFNVIIQAVQNGEWNLLLHSQIMDDAEAIPVKSGTFKIFKMTHFYYQKQKFKPKPYERLSQPSPALQICRFFIDRIENDPLRNRIVKNFTDPNSYLKTHLNGVIVRSAEQTDFNEIYAMLYEEGNRTHYGLLALLRLYFSSQEQSTLPSYDLASELTARLTRHQQRFLSKYRDFAECYGRYYTRRYGKDEVVFPVVKFRNHVLQTFPQDNSAFFHWLNDVVENMKSLAEGNSAGFDAEALLYDENGVYNLTFARFAIEFFLNKLIGKWQYEPLIERSIS